MTVKPSRSGDPKSLAGRPATRAKRLGQVVTPAAVAGQIADRLGARRPPGRVLILDPCVGPHTFPNALFEKGVLRDGDHLTAFDVDTSMLKQTASWLRAKSLSGNLVCADYLASAIGPVDLAILNPPYLRQEWIDAAATYRPGFRVSYSVDVPGTANLYVYFLVKTVFDVRIGGSFSCIIPATWSRTKFGTWLNSFLDAHCSAIEIDHVPGQPFDGVLVDGAIITATVARHAAEISVPRPASRSEFERIDGFNEIDHLFETRRGLRLKQAGFFLCDRADADVFGATPFVKHIRYVPSFAVLNHHPEAALLVTRRHRNGRALAELARRLDAARRDREKYATVLTWWTERPNSWYAHPRPPRAPLLFNYYFRHRPRHIFNPTHPYSDNFYGLRPRTESVPIEAWLAVLNSQAVAVELRAWARQQGAGLSKLQLFEYRRCRVPDLTQLGNADIGRFAEMGSNLASAKDSGRVLRAIDRLVARRFGPFAREAM